MHSCSGNISSAFWQLWELNQDYLYRCCFRWMGGNHTDAEDVLSRAMLKAWEKIRECTDVITNFRAWLTRLTYNLCIDVHRERNRRAKKVESLEAMTQRLLLQRQRARTTNAERNWAIGERKH
ncbi:ECF subfamily RNA polymerase sigma-24 factor [Nostoc sp. NIES-4103]|nr:ECF subfamily RNA polymerase sigma-24 factor [Nostoc sp. NIES-4103]